MRALVTLRDVGARVVKEWQLDGPMVIMETVESDRTTEPFIDECEFVGMSRDSVAASLLDQNACSMRVRIAAAIVISLMGRARFIVSSKAGGKGHVVCVGSVACGAVMRNNLVILDHLGALKLHDSPAVERNHELLYLDVQFE